MTINVSTPETKFLKPKLLIVGVGGGGCNAVNHMIDKKMEGIDFVAANTDAQSLGVMRGGKQLQLGPECTRGQGVGGDPKQGAKAAEESRDSINDMLAGCNMVFIVASLGGGTGTGAAPAIAQQARQMNLLTIGIVTMPFESLGRKQKRIAEEGLAEMEKNVDTLLTIPNDKINDRDDAKSLEMEEAHAIINEVLYSVVSGITDLMARPGVINLDFADVRAVMKDMGRAIIGTGFGNGDNRGTKAAEAAINNPMLVSDEIKGARSVLVSIAGSKVLLADFNSAVTRIRQEVHEDALITAGLYNDETLGDDIRVLVIATGTNMTDEEVEQAGDTLMPVPPPRGLHLSGGQGTRVAAAEHHAARDNAGDNDNIVPLHTISANGRAAPPQTDFIAPLPDEPHHAADDGEEASGAIHHMTNRMFGWIRNPFRGGDRAVSDPPPVTPQTPRQPVQPVAKPTAGVLAMPTSAPVVSDVSGQEEVPLPSFLRSKV